MIPGLQVGETCLLAVRCECGKHGRSNIEFLFPAMKIIRIEPPFVFVGEDKGANYRIYFDDLSEKQGCGLEAKTSCLNTPKTS